MKFECRCGRLISDANDALPHKAHLIADQDFAAALDAVEQGDVRAWVELRRIVYQCEHCGRLWVNDSGGTLHAFAPEHGAGRRLTAGRSRA